MEEYEDVFALVFDTETTGLISKSTDKPFIVQIGFELVNLSQSKVVHREDILINNKLRFDNFVNIKEAVKIHGKTDELLELKGIDPMVAFARIIEKLKSAHMVVAHNLNFDYEILRIMAERLGDRAMKLFNETFISKQWVCTSQYARHFVKSGFKKNCETWKRVPLRLLHKHIFGHEFDNQHDAMADVQATTRCLQYLFDNQVIKPYPTNTCTVEFFPNEKNRKAPTIVISRFGSLPNNEVIKEVYPLDRSLWKDTNILPPPNEHINTIEFVKYMANNKILTDDEYSTKILEHIWALLHSHNIHVYRNSEVRSMMDELYTIYKLNNPTLIPHFFAISISDDKYKDLVDIYNSKQIKVEINNKMDLLNSYN